jgi:hypothetical protein
VKCSFNASVVVRARPSATTSPASSRIQNHDFDAALTDPLISVYLQHAKDQLRADDEVAALRQIRQIIAVAIETLATDATKGAVKPRRHYEILTRCDLMGESHKKVASLLGLSLRHFYRERATARTRLLEASNRRLIVSRRPSLEEHDAFVMSLTRAQMLYDLGKPADSLALLRSMEGSCSDESRRVLVRAMIVDNLSATGRTIAARKELRRWRGELPSEIRAIAEIMEFVCCRNRDGDRMWKLRSRLESSIEALASTASPEWCNFAARQMVLSVDYFLMSDATCCSGLLEKAQKYVGGLSCVSPDIECLFFSRTAAFQLTQQDDDSFLNALARAQNVAAKVGFVEPYALGLGMLSLFQEKRGRGAQSLKVAREAFSLLSQVPGVDARLSIQLRLAAAEVRSGNLKNGINLAKAARVEAAASDEVLSAEAALLEAEGWLGLNRSNDALVLSKYAYEIVGRQPATLREAGLALNVMARAFLDQKELLQAAECSKESMDILERTGFKSSLAIAQKTASLITRGRDAIC